MKIEIEKTDNKGWVVKMDKLAADKLGWDEMIALIAALTMPENRPCIHWMRTQKELDEINKKGL